ncbi:NF-kappa-B essential modulator isoform X2 [Drosophila serrata]|uniref:NF-kappa-B essential modulator isoform X2 n=1 Tax=Drosophila serrata TaxID=7274 RepID=UPI000A1D1F4C|nr:NF-kappa-B essential modulator isoform X2 [Drosophila serrata]
MIGARQQYQPNTDGAMSDEESFVILGSSPYPSLLPDAGGLVLDGLDSGEEALEPTASTSAVSQAKLEKPQPVSSAPASTSGTESMSASQQLRSLDSQAAQSLAASFIMGEVKSDVLKSSVYSQFPSLCSMQASAEDVVKLQNMMTEYLTLKNTLDKVNNTMLNYHKLTQQWRQEAAEREQQCKQQLLECQQQVISLRAENQQLKADLETKISQIEMVQDFSQKEQDDLRKSVSEKTSLINNMRVEIDKLQQLKMHSFEFVPEEVNLTSAQELMAKMQRDIDELKAKDIQKQEEILHLQTQNDIYRRDFEMERADREKNAGEKEQYLMDLRSLQRKNQELIEALAESHRASKSASPASSLSSSRSSLRDDQRPVRVLEPTGAAASRTPEAILRCPICSKSFNALSVLQSHVNDCLDKN